MAGQYFGTLGYDKMENPLGSGVQQFTQNFAAGRQQQRKEAFDAQALAAQLEQQKEELALKKQEMALRERAATNEDEKLKLHKLGAAFDMYDKSLAYGIRVLGSNPTDEQYAEAMQPISSILQQSPEAKNLARHLSREEVERMKPPPETKTALTQQQAREAALSGQPIPADAQIIPDAPSLTQADLKLAQKTVGNLWPGKSPAEKALIGAAVKKVFEKAGIEDPRGKKSQQKTAPKPDKSREALLNRYK
jgi:hypothetical protein